MRFTGAGALVAVKSASVRRNWQTDEHVVMYECSVTPNLSPKGRHLTALSPSYSHLQASSFKYDIPYYHTVIFLLYSYYIPRMNCRHFGLCFFFQHPFFNPRASSFLKVDSSLCSRSQITSPSSIVIHPSLRNNFIYANLSKCRFHCTQVLSYASLSAEEV